MSLSRGFAALLIGGVAIAAQAGDLCAATSARASADPRVAALVHEARAQQARFGGQEIDTGGRLVRAGYDEAEFDRAPGDTQPTWLKVQRFWQAWSAAAPGEVRDSHGRFQRVDLLRQALQSAGNARLESFGGGERDLGLSAREIDTLNTSLTRAALVDLPWSAVFISYLVRTAGFGAEAFTFSDAHADYARAAFATRQHESQGLADPGAYRACDLATTAPRPGDLICNTRARAASVDTFEALGAALQGGDPVPMHCDAVVAVDATKLQAQTIGGNVLQSVTLRNLDLQADAGGPPLLARHYRDDAGRPDASFNDQPWVLLMQLR